MGYIAVDHGIVQTEATRIRGQGLRPMRPTNPLVVPWHGLRRYQSAPPSSEIAVENAWIDCFRRYQVLAMRLLLIVSRGMEDCATGTIYRALVHTVRDQRAVSADQMCVDTAMARSMTLSCLLFCIRLAPPHAENGSHCRTFGCSSRHRCNHAPDALAHKRQWNRCPFADSPVEALIPDPTQTIHFPASR